MREEFMKNLRALNWSYILVAAFFCATRSFAGPVSAAPVFQMRLVVADGPQSEPPKESERMVLVVTNSATGQPYRDILWVSKTVVIDERDLQATRVATSTQLTSNVPGAPEIDVTFTPEGRKRFAEVTRHSIDKRLAIIVDSQVVSAPVIKTEIPGGKAVISGDFSQSEAVELSNKINRALKK
jgi:preprotein translocase subunit SecD